MKPPPFLLGAALLFWGWQSDFLIPGAVMALVLEAARFVRLRWEFSEDDFSRVWTFCSLLFLAAVVFAFTANEGPATFGDFFQNPNFRTQGGAGLSTARTGAALFRWLPMIFFPFITMQAFSVRDAVPLAAVSLLVRRRRKKAKQFGGPIPPARNVNVGYPYFVAVVLSAGVHPAENNTYFWGVAVMLTWALWAHRSRRFAVPVWVGALALAVGLGFFGQRGLGQLQSFLEQHYPRWFARLVGRRFGFDPTRNQTALGNIGDLKSSDAIGIWLETQNKDPMPEYLREASYRIYKSHVWSAGSSKTDFTGINEDFPNAQGWTLLRGKTNTTSVNITCYLQGAAKDSGNPLGLLPLPHGSARLEQLPAYVLKNNSAGAVLAEGPRLLMFDIWYSPGASLDSPADENEDLNIPPDERPAFDALAAELGLENLSREQKLRTVLAHFRNNFTYSTWQGFTRLKAGETHLSRFLSQTHSGHCEYFATATVLLLRAADLQARYAVGYAVHEGRGNKFVVRASDAHAWCLVWDEKTKTWENFDTTPPSWVEVEGKRKSLFQWFKDLWSRLGLEFSKFRYGQSHVRQYLILAVVPVLGLLLYRIIFRRGRKRHSGEKTAEKELFDWPGMDSDFYQLEIKLAERGVARGASEPLNQWLRRVVEKPGLSELRAPMVEILRLHYRYRFDPNGLSTADREALKKQAASCLELLVREEQALNEETAAPV
jgi:hypothetical protein